jgi:hypothetical protein
MGKFTDWLAATLYVSEEDIQTHKDVAAAQDAAVLRQREEGKRGYLETYSLRKEINSAGNMLGDYKEKNTGVLALGLTVPWWIWAAMIGAAFWYLGGFVWLKGILARHK